MKTSVAALTTLALAACSQVLAAPLNKRASGTGAPPPPPGGIDKNATAPPPNYAPVGGPDGFDYQSLALALHQEWIELDLFHWALATFSVEEFEKYGINADYRFLIQHMADQEVGHATLISNMLGAGAPKQCSYQYNVSTVPEWIDLCQKLTRWGESGVYGFINSLESRAAGQMLLQSITTEARQQMTFNQFQGRFPYPEHFEAGIPQTFAWTLLAPYITECPAENSPLKWQIFPKLTVVNNPSATDLGFQALPFPQGGPAISHNRTAISEPGRKIELSWKDQGTVVGPYNTTTYVGAKVETNATSPLWAAFIMQLNVTYVPIEVSNGTYGTTIQPNATVFETTPNNQIVNGTSFIAVVSNPLPVTPYNISLLQDYVVAGPAIYQAS